MTSFDTTEDDIQNFADKLRKLMISDSTSSAMNCHHMKEI
jgi:hypothetical protein